MLNKQTSFQPLHEKTINLGLGPGLTRTGLYKHRSRLKAWKKRDFTINEAKTKALISCADTAQLIGVFGFAYADCLFSYEAAHFQVLIFSLYALSIERTAS